jgi:hypothetical protein
VPANRGARSTIQGAETFYQGDNRGVDPLYCDINNCGGNAVYGRKPRRCKMSETAREFAANYRKPPLHTRFKKGQSGNPRGRPVKNLAELLAAALNENVTVTENGKRRQVTKREAVIAQLVNKSASAEPAGHQDADRDAAGDRTKDGSGAAREKPLRPLRSGGVSAADHAAAPQHVPRLSRAAQEWPPLWSIFAHGVERAQWPSRRQRASCSAFDHIDGHGPDFRVVAPPQRQNQAKHNPIKHNIGSSLGLQSSP